MVSGIRRPGWCSVPAAGDSLDSRFAGLLVFREWEYRLSGVYWFGAVWSRVALRASAAAFVPFWVRLCGYRRESRGPGFHVEGGSRPIPVPVPLRGVIFPRSIGPTRPSAGYEIMDRRDHGAGSFPGGIPSRVNIDIWAPELSAVNVTIHRQREYEDCPATG